ncbi:phospholipid transport system substrate-binding protein [Enhydrobacter aerosaccus]|uniref:Phospholipid transport system substrate-binding protein n=1 Tax=Enhydrobacter aerosaccus TaxID=225324 RepID=A0A1T4MT30_9HYPH|nr:ABC transporter substrate-binding protein [Enhydrobacter aerosaccus]SJZ69974.1 phospholipid transport system substrate-binding protein [Enhydrobacter aerosaccus]
MSQFASRRHVLRLAAGAAAIASTLSVPLAVHAADAPAATFIESVANRVIELIKSTTPGPAREAAFKKVLETDFDLNFMGRSALGTHWNGTTPEEQQRFLKAAASAEAHAYSERFGQYLGQTLSVGRVSPRPNGVSVVDSKLNQSNGQPISIQWEVRDEAGRPRITDVKVEGVSMVMTRRSDFNSYIQNHGGKVDALIAELESRAKQ